MTRWFSVAQLSMLALFVVIVLSMAAYEMIFVWPAKKCEAGGDWWDARDLQCLTPIPIARFTGHGLAIGPAPNDQRVAPGAQRTSPRP